MTEPKQTIIIGAGLTGLTAALTIKRHAPDHRLVVLEKNARAGGVIRSFIENGFVAEYGPHGFLDNCPESIALLAETGLDQECVKAPLKDFVRYVCIDGRLMMIPQSPLKIITAPLIPLKDKLRVLGDLFIPPLKGEPTAAKWCAHRFGKALLPYLDAVFTGTYAGDYNELKIDAVMPGVRQLEKDYGSVIRGAIAKACCAKKQQAPGKRLKMPAMTSFPGGMQRLSEALAARLAAHELLLDCEVTAIRKTEAGWLVEAHGSRFSAENLFLALPINQCLALLTGPDFFPEPSCVPEAWIGSVVFGFQGAQLPPGFGFLIPEREQRFALGALFSSNMFPHRAPRGHVVVETLVGGKRHPERLCLDDETITTRALADIRELLDLFHTPVYSTVLRPTGAIPQLEKEYPPLLRRRNELVETTAGLYICGFGWEGIGINDMIKTATGAALKLVAGIPQFQEQSETKKIYF